MIVKASFALTDDFANDFVKVVTVAAVIIIYLSQHHIVLLLPIKIFNFVLLLWWHHCEAEPGSRQNTKLINRQTR